MAILVALVLLFAGFCPAVLCQPDGTLGSDTELQEDKNNMSKVDILTLASINTDFAFSLYKELALENPDKNIVFSPLSISAALAVLSLGANNNTLQEILEGLKFNLTETPEADIHRGFGQLLLMLSQPNNQVQINIGSTMFVEKHLQILAEFKEKARALYQAEASSVDFQQPHEVKNLINDYVRKQTHGKIKDLVSGLDKSALMVLVNYIYFKGKWRMPFNPQRTRESNFYLDNKRTVKVPMMHDKFLTIPYFRDEELFCTVVELKYRGNASALFILPDQGKMQQVEASLQPETLRKWRDSLRPRKIDELSLPKFSISTAYSLERSLPQLGIRELFSTKADLSGITGAKDLSVSQVVHKAVLDVAETGTEAAAATGMMMVGSALILDPLEVHLDRPFLMIISDTDTQSSLFMAKVTNPKEN
ncbi:serine protease inhibitor A3N-like [Microtus ochrogaster]|uniref:Serine protease inhibitor A3N-like n=1 Tax=Microtus ochrogaster TaxID=79684 RepID=A0ABM1AJC0_MICOH|nr:serine protease inhibitor A3N-like [Microtus ochrogaster]